ncbi:hypothetical protein GCM10017083_45920 [Thalassobaculum fulvum]|uniref:Multicopper oxidase with three cupredoxin domains (Includes cell division protein FtsP and spore coat protein CotA) n=2 Tax=Thalassobaculum fulvum TaxID=1633335 RepID=A0A919CRQ2_9PROT|nr:hypothetical protein GCM10017083_45920 [Thalassobaculum fulvum]
MKRRDFLLGSAATLMAAPAAAHMAHSGGMHTKASGSLELLEGMPLEDLPRLANAAATPGLFQAELLAGPSTVRYVPDLETPVLAYNGTCPGPLIEATEGDRVRITFRNEIPGQESTIHWHGMRVPADQDGNPQDAVPTGTDRVYEFTLPEDSAGPYWYHPHPHDLTAEQFYRGLNGVFLVKPKADPIPPEYGDTILFLTDLRLAPDGTMPESTPADMMNGRVGDHVLVNGQKNPLMILPQGTRRRFRLYNAMNGRYLRLTFGEGAMTVVGTDGGLIEAPVPGVSEVLLSPAERIEVVVDFAEPGTRALKTLPYDRGWMGPGVPDDGDLTLLTVEVTEADKPVEMPPLPATLRRIEPLGEPVVTRRFELGEVMGHMHHAASAQAGGTTPQAAAMPGGHDHGKMAAGHDHGAMAGMSHDHGKMAGTSQGHAMATAAESKATAGMGQSHGTMAAQDHGHMTPGPGHAHGAAAGMGMAFLINGKIFDMDRIDIRPKVGDVELWEVVNPTDMDHPFHVHGTQFQIVEIEGPDGAKTKPPYLAWKDMVNIRPGETARFLIRQDTPGLRMYHCHILEHARLGMMANAEVIAAG